MDIKVVTEPTSEPISVAEAKEACRIDADDDSQDTYLNVLITTSRRRAEQLTGRAVAYQLIDVSYKNWGEECPGELKVPMPPLQSVEYIKYKDADGVLQTLAADQYQIDTFSEPAKVKPAYGVAWPTIRVTDYNAVQLRAYVGWPAGSPNQVPAEVRLWMMQRCATWFKHREAVITGTILTNVPRDFVDSLLDAQRPEWF